MAVVVVSIPLEIAIDSRAFDERERLGKNAHPVLSVGSSDDKVSVVWQVVANVVIVVHSERQLFEVVRALHSSRGFARRLYGRQKEPDENADNRDNDEQLDERKASLFVVA